MVADPGPVPGRSPAAIQLLQSVDGLAQAGPEVRVLTPRPAPGIAADVVLGRPLHSSVMGAYVADLRKRWFWPSRSSRPFYWLARANCAVCTAPARRTRCWCAA